jgi:hypothetical protein
VEVFENETKFYREILGISYEFGSRLKARGVLVPDDELGFDELRQDLEDFEREARDQIEQSFEQAYRDSEQSRET